MIIVSIISGALVLSVSLSGQTSAMEKDIIQHHIVVADIASQSIEAGYLAQRWPFETLKEISKCENVLFWWIVKPDGEILLADDTAMWGKQINDESLGTNKTVVKDSAFPKTGENIKLIAHPLDMKEEGEQWTFYLGISLESVVDAGNKMIVDGIGSSVAIIIMVIIISAYFTKTITRPVIKLTEGAKAVADGNLGYHITVKAKDEIGALAENFNRMTGDLKKSRMKLEEDGKTLERKVAERTEELHESKKNLEKTVVDLQRSRYATLNIMSDIKTSNQELKVTRENLALLNQNLEGKVQERTAKVKELLRQKDEFINQLGHDLKSPLTPLMRILPKVMEDPDNPKTKERLDIINRNVDYIKNLALGTLKLARLNSESVEFDFQDINLLNLTDNIIEDNQFLFGEKDIKVENEIDKNISVYADEMQLRELFTNLSSNTVKFVQNGGKVTFNAKEDNGVVRISIKDTGIGMTKEHTEHIFDEFYKVDSSRHELDSSGLGLSICKRIVEKHGGEICVESPGLGKGTIFYFAVPSLQI